MSSVDSEVDGVEFKIKGLKINTGSSFDGDLPPPPPPPPPEETNHKYDIYLDEQPLVMGDLPPPPPLTDYMWTPPGLDLEEVNPLPHSLCVCL